MARWAPRCRDMLVVSFASLVTACYPTPTSLTLEDGDVSPPRVASEAVRERRAGPPRAGPPPDSAAVPEEVVEVEAAPVVRPTGKLEELRYRTGTCFGRCPEQHLVLRPNGRFLYYGGLYSRRRGVYLGRAPRVKVTEIFDMLRSGPWGKSVGYSVEDITDLRVTSTTVLEGADPHRVSVYGGESSGAPAIVFRVEAALDEIIAAIPDAKASERPRSYGLDEKFQRSAVGPACHRLGDAIRERCREFTKSEIPRKHCLYHAGLAGWVDGQRFFFSGKELEGACRFLLRSQNNHDLGPEEGRVYLPHIYPGTMASCHEFFATLLRNGDEAGYPKTQKPSGGGLCQHLLGI